MAIFFSPEIYFYKKKSEKLFWSLTQSLTHYHRFAVVVQERGVVVRGTRLRCIRLQYRTCKTSRRHFTSHDLGVHSFSTERVRLAAGNFASYALGVHSFSTERAWLAGGTLLRLWFQKSACYLWIFFFQNTTDFETWSLIFFHLNFFQNYFSKIRQIYSS